LIRCGNHAGQRACRHSRKLDSAQKNCTAGEKELSSFVESLKEHLSVGSKELHVHADHKNIAFSRLNTQWVSRWRLFLEECSPVMHHVKGEHETLADVCLFQRRRNKNPGNQCKNDDLSLNDSWLCSMAINDDDLLDCFVHLPDQAGVTFALDYETVADAQKLGTRDAELQQLAQQDPGNCSTNANSKRAHLVLRPRAQCQRACQMNCSSLPLDGATLR
jgi:hypothetical protein